jgi:hypothetical protein
VAPVYDESLLQDLLLPRFLSSPPFPPSAPALCPPPSALCHLYLPSLYLLASFLLSPSLTFTREDSPSASGPLIAVPTLNPRKKTPVLSIGDLNKFLEEQMKNFGEKKTEFQKLFPDDGKMITFREAQIISALVNSGEISEIFRDSVAHVEETMRRQLASALGKEISARDFSEYMEFHNRKIFAEKFRPRPFSFSVRQPGCSPEGTISVEKKWEGLPEEGGPKSGNLAEPVNTFVKKRIGTSIPMEFSISASSRV